MEMTIGICLRFCFIEEEGGEKGNACTYICCQKVSKPNRISTSYTQLILVLNTRNTPTCAYNSHIQMQILSRLERMH